MRPWLLSGSVSRDVSEDPVVGILHPTVSLAPVPYSVCSRGSIHPLSPLSLWPWEGVIAIGEGWIIGDGQNPPFSPSLHAFVKVRPRVRRDWLPV